MQRKLTETLKVGKITCALPSLDMAEMWLFHVIITQDGMPGSSYSYVSGMIYLIRECRMRSAIFKKDHCLLVN